MRFSGRTTPETGRRGSTEGKKGKQWIERIEKKSEHRDCGYKSRMNPAVAYMYVVVIPNQSVNPSFETRRRPIQTLYPSSTSPSHLQSICLVFSRDGYIVPPARSGIRKGLNYKRVSAPAAPAAPAPAPTCSRIASSRSKQTHKTVGRERRIKSKSNRETVEKRQK